MKKRVALLLILVMVVTVIFAGCDMIKLNEDRDDALIVSNVKYEGLTETVTKKELKTYFNANGYIFVQYYGMSVKEAYDYCAELLSQQKLIKLKATNELCKKLGLDPKTLKIVDHTAKIDGTNAAFKNIYSDILWTDEKIQLVEDYNEQMQSLLDEFIAEIEKEEALDKEEEDNEDDTTTEEEEPENKPEIRTERPEEEEEDPEVKADEKYSTEELNEKKEKLNGLNRFEVQWELDEKKGGVHTDKEKEAKKRLDQRLNKIGKTYNDFFEDLVNSMLVSHYKEVVVSGLSDEEISNLYQAKYDETFEQNKQAFVYDNPTSEGNVKKFREDAYKSQIGSSTVIYHPIVADTEKEVGTAGYGYTFNILLNFETVDANVYAEKKAQFTETDNVIDDKEQEILDNLAKESAKNIKVDISNPNYKSTEKCASGITSDHLNDKNENGEYMYKDKYGYHKCDDPNCPLKPFGYDVGDTYGSVLSTEEKDLIKAGYDVPVLTVLKMINYDLVKINEEYDAKAQSATDKLAVEYERQVALREKFVQWIYKVNDDPGMFSSDNAKGYLVPKNGKSDYVDSYTEQSRKLMGGEKVGEKGKETFNYPSTYYKDTHYVGNYSTSTIKKEANTFEDFENMIAISEYGIHIIMIADMPGFYSTDGKLNANAIVEYGRTDYVTLEQSWKNGIRTTLENNMYEDDIRGIVNDYKKYVTINANVYKSLYE